MLKLFGSIGRGVERATNWLNSGGAWLAVICLWAMAAIIFVDIAGRRFLHASTGGVATELSGYFLVVITFMAAALTLVKGRHISITALLSVLSARTRKVVVITNAFVALAFTLIMIWYTFQLPLASFRSGTIAMNSNLSTPMVIPESIVPASLIILALATILIIAKLLKKPAEELKDTDEHTPPGSDSSGEAS